MGQTIKLNQKANVKQGTDADILPSNGLPVIAEYTADSTIGQTLIPAVGSLPFTIDTTAPQNVWLFINGQRLSYIKDFTFLNIDGTGRSSQIQLNSALADVYPIVLSKLGVKPEQEFGVDTRFTSLYDVGADEFQGYVSEQGVLTPVNGTPGTGQFRSSISNRASIPDITNDVKARFGVDRIHTNEVHLIPNEYGPNGEQVWSTPNDTKGLIRFVGTWNNDNSTAGCRPDAGSTGLDYVEVTFFGTGLNALYLGWSSSITIQATVDGNAEGSNIVPANVMSIQNGRNFGVNNIVPIVNNLSQGLHTVKIRSSNASAALELYGIEILNESQNINVRPGLAVYGNQKRIVSAATNSPLLTGFDSFTQGGASVGSLGSRGARVIQYVKSDGTIGKAAYLVNGAQANLTSADHTYEDVSRVYNPREFGDGRSDDFSLALTNGIYAGTLEDNVTTLVTNNANMASPFNGAIGVGFGSSATLALTFVGTGLDLVFNSTNANTVGVTIDGTSVGNITTGTNGLRTYKVVSGLPYGTHTVQVSIASAVNITLNSYIVYQPKKPTIPSGAVEIADYCLMATYVANTTQGVQTIATGVLRRAPSREWLYRGSGWGFNSINAAVPCGWNVATSTNGDIAQYTFFGTGFELRAFSSSSGWSTTIAVDGSTNLSGFTTSVYGSGATFTASTGVAAIGTGNGAAGVGFCVSGLALGLHTVTITRNSGTNSNDIEALDVITPVHYHKTNTYVLNGMLSVGNSAIGDTRAITPNRELPNVKKQMSQCFGLVSGPGATVANGIIPLSNMNTTIKSPGAWYDITFDYQGLAAAATTTMHAQIYVDGIACQNEMQTSTSNSTYGYVSVTTQVYLPPGYHHIDGYFKTDNQTLNNVSNNRHLKVMER